MLRVYEGGLFTDTTSPYLRRVSYREALAFYASHHYSRGVSNSALSFGVYEREALTACVSFGTPCSENVRRSLFGDAYKHNVVELQRLARAPTCSVLPSSIVSVAIDETARLRRVRGLAPLLAVLSFADEHEGHLGGVYQAMSWFYIGESRASVLTFRDVEGRLRHRRQNGQNITEAEGVSIGCPPYRALHVKHRYVKLCGSPLQRKALRRALRFPILPYPKTKAP